MDNEVIALASDHAGFFLKNKIVDFLRQQNYSVLDLGADNDEVSVDYPLQAEKLAHSLKEEKASIGILVCGTGIGMSIAINRYPFIRGALVYEEKTALLARQHNNANVLCLGGRMIDFETAKKLVSVFLKTPFEGGRHERRVQQLGEMK